MGQSWSSCQRQRGSEPDPKGFDRKIQARPAGCPLHSSLQRWVERGGSSSFGFHLTPTKAPEGGASISVAPESALSPQGITSMAALITGVCALGRLSGFPFLLLFLAYISSAAPVSSLPSSCFRSKLQSEEPLAPFLLVAF